MSAAPQLKTSGEPFKPVYITTVKGEQYWIERSRSNVADFITYITDGAERPAKHHLQWMYYILSHPRTNIVAPRGSAKTDTLKRILAWVIGKKPWLNNFIGSVSATQAIDRLRDIRMIIEHDRRYHNVFPWIHLDDKMPQNMKEFSVWSNLWKDGNTNIDYAQWRMLISRYGESKGHTLSAAGITSSGVIGKRFTGLVLLDDPHDESNSANPEQREKVVSFVKRTLIPCLVPDSNAKLCVISTRWAENDLAGVLATETRRDGSMVWKTLEMPAIDDKGQSYWPEVWPLDKLEERREEVGDVMFELMYMNNPLGMASGEFTFDMLKRGLPEQLPEFKELLITVDLSYSAKERADYTVFTAIARDRNQKFGVYVLDIMRFKMAEIGKKLDKLEEFADDIFLRYGKLDGICFQQVAGEPAYGMELRKRGRLDLPVKIVPTKGDKETRMKSVAIVVHDGRFYANTQMKYYMAMCSEMVSFPGVHDDICDTLSLPFQLDSWREKRTVKAELSVIKSKFLM